MKDLLTVREVADYFSVKPLSVHRWTEKARRGQTDFPLPVLPKTFKMLWRRSDIENYTSRIGVEPKAVAANIETPAA